MCYTNDIIRRLQKAEFAVDVKTLEMVSAGRKTPQLNFGVRDLAKQPF